MYTKSSCLVDLLGLFKENLMTGVRLNQRSLIETEFNRPRMWLSTETRRGRRGVFVSPIFPAPRSGRVSSLYLGNFLLRLETKVD